MDGLDEAERFAFEAKLYRAGIALKSATGPRIIATLSVMDPEGADWDVDLLLEDANRFHEEYPDFTEVTTLEPPAVFTDEDDERERYAEEFGALINSQERELPESEYDLFLADRN